MATVTGAGIISNTSAPGRFSPRRTRMARVFPRFADAIRESASRGPRFSTRQRKYTRLIYLPTCRKRVISAHLLPRGPRGSKWNGRSSDSHVRGEFSRDYPRTRNAARKVPPGDERKKKKRRDVRRDTRARENGRPNLKRTSHGRGDCANTSANMRRQRARRSLGRGALPTSVCSRRAHARARLRVHVAARLRVCARVRVCVAGAVLVSCSLASALARAFAVTGSTSSISMLPVSPMQRPLARLSETR